MKGIKRVIRNTENKSVTLVLNNGKEVTRKLKRDVSAEGLYFVYDKTEYYLNQLQNYRIEVVDEN